MAGGKRQEAEPTPNPSKEGNSEGVLMKKFFSPLCMKIPLDPSPCSRVYFQIKKVVNSPPTDGTPPLQMKETSQILFPPASCLLPPALFLERVKLLLGFTSFHPTYNFKPVTILLFSLFHLPIVLKIDKHPRTGNQERITKDK